MPPGKYADVNGQRIYYEERGSGRALVLLHGGATAVGVFEQSIPLFEPHRRVIAVHLQGHGHTRDVDRPLRYETLADDVAALLTVLGIDKADLLGYSLGGGVALQTAIRHPEKVDRLVLAATTMKHQGSYPEVLAAFEHMEESAPMIAANLKQSPFATAYPEVDWERLFRKTGEMNKRPFDWSADVAKLGNRTMLVFADADSVTPDHMVEFWKALGGGQRDAGLDGSQRPAARLAVIPGTTHYNLFDTRAVADAVVPFLLA